MPQSTGLMKRVQELMIEYTQLPDRANTLAIAAAAEAICASIDGLREMIKQRLDEIQSTVGNAGVLK